MAGTQDPRPLPWAAPRLWGTEIALVEQALKSSWISGGPFVEQFESRVSAVCGSAHAIATSNGTTALHMAFLALGIGRGDEVIVPGFAFMAAANVALHVGATPVFADVDPETWCIDADAIERCVSPRTRLIVPVHTYGNVSAMRPILESARHHGIPVLEDAAESFSSRYRGAHAGSMGTLGSFSFHATKTITTGEGGMVVTNDSALADGMRLYRSHGMGQHRYRHEVIGHNFRLTNLQAALGCAQLDALDRIVQERKRVHRRYVEGLADVPGVVLQRFGEDVVPVLWAFAVRLEEAAFPAGRDVIAARLLEAGIETRPGFVAASMMPLYDTGALPVSEQLAREVISLPTFPGLEDEDIHRIVNSLRRLAAG